MDSGRPRALFFSPAQSSIGIMVNRKQQLFNNLNFKGNLIEKDLSKK